jgi:transposase
LRARTAEIKTGGDIKLSSFVSDVFGASGMAMLHALVEGTASLEQMAQMAKGRLRTKIPELELALEGRLEEHHRFLLELQLRRLKQVDTDLAQLEARVEQQLAPYSEQRKRLMKIPGVDRTVAAILLAELGPDMSAFKSGAHLAAWAGVCPGNNESAGQRKSSQTRKGNHYLKTALVEAALAASRKAGSYLKDKFFRLKARRGYKRAAMAIAHKILMVAYQILCTGAEYKELGEAYLDQLDQRRVVSNLVRRIERLGYSVMVAPTKAPAAPA